MADETRVQAFVHALEEGGWVGRIRFLLLVAALAMMFFFLSVGVNFTTAKRLFDRRLALFGMGLILVADTFWGFSISGLPQMLMLLIFSITTYTLVRAVQAREEGKNPMLWLVLTG